MIKNTIKIASCLVALGIIFLSGWLSHRTQAPVGGAGLSVYQKFQLLNPVAFGVVTSNGISTTTLTATPSPTLASLTATSTTATSSFSGGIMGKNVSAWGYLEAPYLNATSTATSTFTGGITAKGLSAWSFLDVATINATSTATSSFAGPIKTTNIAASSQSSGCAQFGAGGYLTSTGSSCGAGGGSGATMVSHTATTSVNFYYNQGGSATMSTTTPINTGDSMMIWASCSISSPSHPGNEIWAIRVANPGGGTTTVAEIYASNTGVQVSTFGQYVSTTTGTARVEIDQRTNTAFDNFSPEVCQDPSILMQRFSN